MVVTDEKKRAIFEQLAHVLKTPRQADDEITAREYAEFNSCTHRKAYTQLMSTVIDGKMTKRKVLANRNWSWAFKLVIDEETT